jgi:undecaprenyl-diphosphatase
VGEALRSVDLVLRSWLMTYHSAPLDVAMIWISRIGQGGTLWIALAAIAFAAARYRAAAWRVLLTLLVAAVLTDGILKPLVARARPDPNPTAVMRALPPAPPTFSLPSGHAATTFGGAVAVTRMWPQGAAVWWTAAILISYSRIYLGHHYPLDVVSGALVGILAALWVLGGRHRSTYTRTLPTPLPPGVIVRP